MFTSGLLLGALSLKNGLIGVGIVLVLTVGWLIYYSWQNRRGGRD